MSYTQSSTVAATDYNLFVGDSNVNSAYSSSILATNKIAALLGIGFGDRGYGQSTPSLSPKTQGNTILASDWLNLRNAIATIASHQGTSTTLLPPSDNFVAGANIKAETSPYDFQTLIANIDSNRFNNNSGGSMSLATNQLSITRSGTWGAGNSSITSSASATFPNEDSARYFFNTGGEIRFLLSHPSGSTQDSNWSTALTSIGTIAFKAHSTTRAGSIGTPANIGYYELTTSNQTILSGIIGTSAYSSNSISISARSANIIGSNGAKGSQIIFTITIADSHTNPFSDIVAAGTSVVFSHLKATALLTGISSPNIAQVQPWL